MKRIGILLLTLLFIPLRPTYAETAEAISDFRVQLEVRGDATIRVTESIAYDFGSYERHGIFRTIPVKYNARGGTYRLRISDVMVTEGERPIPSSTSTPGSNFEIKIGDANTLVTGAHTYLITYTVDRAINSFDDHDEVYWNATGNEWQVPIERSEATVKLPAGVSADNIDLECFVGATGSTFPCDIFPPAESTAVFSAKYLAAGEGLTVVVGFPKGVVYEPSALERILATVRDNFILALPVIVFAIFLWIWWTRGRDPKGRGTIIAEYDAPDNLTPAEVGTVLDEHANRRDISSLLIHLAVNGYLDITRVEKKFRKDDYLFKKLKDEKTLPNDFERTLLSKMFGEKNEIQLSDLKNTFYKDLAEVEKQLYAATVTKGYFVKNPRTVRATYMIIGGILAAAGAPLVGGLGGLAVASVAVSGIIIFLFGFAMPAKTAKGVRAREHILGLKEYLTVAEKDRLKFHNAPEKNPKHFEALLPFAMVLGVETEWAKQFEGMYTTPPSWYHDSSGRVFSSLYLASALSDFESRTGSVLSSHPSSAAGGGSGLGGGGFSGGGFGGGGGGSW
ncbi:MAG: DUF2207 domain-containing protein [Candidatus Kerfeldbacteria bacterium]|nr:DUF2207 domain-containing protein [Candidatus Kerfeldbacteria bacterium]